MIMGKLAQTVGGQTSAISTQISCGLSPINLTVDEAVGLWKALRNKVNSESLNDKEQHDIVHRISEVIAKEIREKRMTYQDFERRLSL
jgi:hypothetical protein